MSGAGVYAARWRSWPRWTTFTHLLRRRPGKALPDTTAPQWWVPSKHWMTGLTLFASLTTTETGWNTCRLATGASFVPRPAARKPSASSATVSVNLRRSTRKTVTPFTLQRPTPPVSKV
ncbi:hypothetical protein PIB30_102167 [Stylosanthes scabra]|uniref:Uncharacterized protein n=1 Tax=Stylosanthes scabra TaxID=79078 RepID=A0ABU6WW43_9FABA|nr:hypothetical protein [Stylosanthes scabra]